jgi:hypothetical protein
MCREVAGEPTTRHMLSHMRVKHAATILVLLGGVASVARAQHHIDAGMDASTAPLCSATPGQTCEPTAPVTEVGPLLSALTPTDSDAGVTDASPGADAVREPCAEAIRAVQFEDAHAAEVAYQQCRARVAGRGRVPLADDVRTLEDVTEALHGLRREDGTFCVAPSAPFDFTVLMGTATDTRTCFLALDRFLSSDNSVWRFAVVDPYISGRLATRGGFDVITARRMRRRPEPGSIADRELLATARLAGRHFMRSCRCLPGPQPDSITAVRGMQLPSTVESVLLRGLEERDGTHGEPLVFLNPVVPGVRFLRHFESKNLQFT